LGGKFFSNGIKFFTFNSHAANFADFYGYILEYFRDADWHVALFFAGNPRVVVDEGQRRIVGKEREAVIGFHRDGQSVRDLIECRLVLPALFKRCHLPGFVPTFGKFMLATNP